MNSLARIAPIHVGPVVSAVPGRTDRHEVDVPSDSFVLPADVVSALGEGNTAAGQKVVSKMFGLPEGGHQHLGRNGIPIVIAGGETVIPPGVVRRIGGGSIEKGHKVLREWVLAERKKLIKTLGKLKGPHK